MQRQYVLTAIAGILAASLVGIGEYLLHFDELARFTAGGYEFMSDISTTRATIGHFFGVFGATLYPIGCYHIYLMLRPANPRWAFSAFLIGSFGFMVGVVWIGSRASIATLAQLPESVEVMQLIELYFVLFAVVPSVGKHTMPIALNVAFFIFFLISMPFAYQAQQTDACEARVEPS